MMKQPREQARHVSFYFILFILHSTNCTIFTTKKCICRNVFFLATSPQLENQKTSNPSVV